VHLIVPSYKLYIDFGQFDAIDEIIWRAKSNFHAPSQSTMAKGFNHVETSAPIQKNLVHRVQSLITSQRGREDVNPKIRGLKEIVEQKKQKLHDNR